MALIKISRLWGNHIGIEWMQTQIVWGSSLVQALHSTACLKFPHKVLIIGLDLIQNTTNWSLHCTESNLSMRHAFLRSLELGLEYLGTFTKRP